MLHPNFQNQRFVELTSKYLAGRLDDWNFILTVAKITGQDVRLSDLGDLDLSTLPSFTVEAIQSALPSLESPVAKCFSPLCAGSVKVVGRCGDNYIIPTSDPNETLSVGPTQLAFAKGVPVYTAEGRRGIIIGNELASRGSLVNTHYKVMVGNTELRVPAGSVMLARFA